MPFASEQTEEHPHFQTGRLGAFDLRGVFEQIADGLADEFRRLFPAATALPEQICREVVERWNDPKFQHEVREKTAEALAAVLREKLPGSIADPAAAYVAGEILWPAFRFVGDRLIEHFCGAKNGAPAETDRAARRKDQGEREILR